MKNNYITKIIFFFLLIFLNINSNALALQQNFKNVINYHDFTGLPLTQDGWTDLSKLIYENSRIIYVSTSGDDNTAINYTNKSFADPYNPISPKAYSSLSAAYSQLRTGFPDIMLLKRGDTWNDNFPSWFKSGESKTKRMIVGAYGPISLPRPKTGRFNILYDTNFLIVTSLVLDENERSINIERTASHILFEDILSPPSIAYSGIIVQNIDGDGGIDYLAFRRSGVIARWRPDNKGYNQGMYIDDSINLLVEECIFDQNGWEDGGGESSEDIKAHNTYIMLGKTGNEKHIFRYNISTRGRASGIQAGSGGLIYANLSVQDGIGIQVAREDNWWDDGFGGIVKYNVILHGRDVNSFDRRGFGMSINNVNNMTIEDNIIAGNYETGQPYGIRIAANARNGVMMYVRNLILKNNIIHDWNGLNIVGGDAIAIFSDPFYDNVTYSHGSDPDEYVTGISIIDNQIHITNQDLKLINAHFESDIVSSGENSFYSTSSESSWFRIADINQNLNSYKTVVGDSSSTIAQTVPSGPYGITDYLSSINEVSSLDSFYSHLRAQRKGNWDYRYTAIPIINFVREKFGRSPLPNYEFTGQ